MFQSLIGRLKTTRGNHEGTIAREFQSLIGRLKTARHLYVQTAYDSFQSLIGRLKTSWVEIATNNVSGFNPL